jgi:superfamily II DNA or RNA helicase
MDIDSDSISINSLDSDTITDKSDIDETNSDIDETNSDIDETISDIDETISDIDETISESDEKTITKSENENENNEEYISLSADDPDIQLKLYKKKEFYIYKTPGRPNVDTYEKLSKYRKQICDPPKIEMSPYQNLLPSFLNPNTPFQSLLVYSGVGIGKTCLAINIAQTFIPQVQKYNTKIYIVVPGTLLKKNWKEELINCTGDYFLKTNRNIAYLNEEEKEKMKQNAINEIKQYYKIISYESLHRKVIGNKIVETSVIVNSKLKNVYKTTETGEVIHEVAHSKIHNLNNTLIIFDEAHNLTGNERGGDTLRKLLKESTNLKLLLLTATPCKNLADDCIELLNFCRPLNSQIDRNKIFTSNSDSNMELKQGGLEYFKKMASGYISHFRGADELTFATGIEMGEIPKGLLFTKLITCYMEKLQNDTYDKIIKEGLDSLDRKSESLSNFVIPILDDSRKKLIGSFGLNGINELKNQLQNNKTLINKLIAENVLKIKYDPQEEYISINETSKNITGKILHKNYLKHFSTKFHQALIDLEENIFNEEEPRTGFVYSNLVKIGIDIFEEILLKNGFLEYNKNNKTYNIADNTICYSCGKPYLNHSNITHTFSPATYIKVTGQNTEDEEEIMQEEKQSLIKDIFNKVENKNGKIIKVVLGSKVMNEGISLKNVSSVFVLDTYFNYGRLEQVIGRAIRWCSHYRLMSEKNPYPKVKIYKYAIGLKNGELSTEEELYQKAEKKYILVKKMERAMKEVAIDCALNISGNQFKEEIEEYKGCVEPSTNNVNDKNIKKCVAKCDFMECLYTCDNKKLNLKYYDPSRNIYRQLEKNEIDNSTMTVDLMKNEIKYVKSKIKELYYINFLYDLNTIVEHVKEMYKIDKKELFDIFYVYKSLDDLMPITTNDFLNFRDSLHDKYNRIGYLIYVNGYYVFQPVNESENITSYYRKNITSIVDNTNYGLSVFLKHYHNYTPKNTETFKYDFDTEKEYYNKRPEWDYVGILDFDNAINEDVFKIRERIKDKNITKKRGVGIISYRGSTCFNSKTKEEINAIGNKLKIKNINDMTKVDACNTIKNILFEIEKYNKDKDKKTFFIIPSNHPTIKFPLNLQDRVEYLKENINKLFSDTTKFKIQENPKSYVLEFSKEKIPNTILNKILELGFTQNNDNFSITIE